MNTRSVLECGDSSPSNALTPDDESLGTESCDRSQHSTTSGLSLALFCLLPSVLCLPAAAQYSLDWSTVDGGGGTVTSGQYTLSGTIGQPDAGEPLAVGQYSLCGGFWGMLAPNAVESATNGLPGLISWWRAEGDASDTMGAHHGTLSGGANFGPG